MPVGEPRAHDLGVVAHQLEELVAEVLAHQLAAENVAEAEHRRVELEVLVAREAAVDAPLRGAEAQVADEAAGCVAVGGEHFGQRRVVVVEWLAPVAVELVVVVAGEHRRVRWQGPRGHRDRPLEQRALGGDLVDVGRGLAAGLLLVLVAAQVVGAHRVEHHQQHVGSAGLGGRQTVECRALGHRAADGNADADDHQQADDPHQAAAAQGEDRLAFLVARARDEEGDDDGDHRHHDRREAVDADLVLAEGVGERHHRDGQRQALGNHARQHREHQGRHDRQQHVEGGCHPNELHRLLEVGAEPVLARQ